MNLNCVVCEKPVFTFSVELWRSNTRIQIQMCGPCLGEEGKKIADSSSEYSGVTAQYFR